MMRWLAGLGLAGICGSALGAEVIDSKFEVDVTRDGQTQTYADLTVPNIPDGACYNWYLKFGATTGEEITLVETLTLPEPLAAWKDYQNDPSADTQVNADAQSAVTTLTVVPEPDSWVTHGWCVAEGDPLGAHSLAVTLAGSEIARWDFAVVAPEEYSFEAPQAVPEEAPPAPPPPSPPPQPSPTDRDVNQSW